MGVLTEFRRQGIAEKLVKAAQAWALQRGASTMELNVWEFNRSAWQLYDKLGFNTLRRVMTIDLGP